MQERIHGGLYTGSSHSVGPSPLSSLGRPELTLQSRSAPGAVGHTVTCGYLRMYCAHLCIVSNICGNMAVMEVVIRSRKYWIASSSVLFS